MVEPECVDSIGAVGCGDEWSGGHDGMAHLRIAQRTIQLPGDRRLVGAGSLVRADWYQRRRTSDLAESTTHSDDSHSLAIVGADIQRLSVRILGEALAMETGGQ